MLYHPHNSGVVHLPPMQGERNYSPDTELISFLNANVNPNTNADN